jgi:spore germination protein KC
MKHIRIISLLAVSAILLTGCWDQKLLRDVRLVYGFSFDAGKDGLLKIGAAIRENPPSTQGPVTPENDVKTVEGKNVLDGRAQLDHQVAGNYKATKAQVFLIGDELAKKDIYSLFSQYFRMADSPLNAKVAIVKGEAHDIIKMRRIGTMLVSEYLFKLIKTAEKNVMVPHTNMMVIFKYTIDPSISLFLPHVAYNKKKNEVKLDGLALMDGRKFSGTVLDIDESNMCMLMYNKKGKINSLTIKVSDEDNRLPLRNYLTVNVDRLHRKISIQPAEGEYPIQVKLDLELDVKVWEYPKDRLDNPEVKKKLDEQLNEELTKRAEKVIKKLQKSRCDIFGIARELIAYHPELWNKVKDEWETVFSNMTFKPQVHARIAYKGNTN